ncbi:MAG: hypothetical protein K2O06_15480 [Acetatifactor sp.]|nr:hypothetical protein [Acetatifactor sp.]
MSGYGDVRLEGYILAEKEMEDKLNALTKGWNTDEMIALLVECEMVLSYNKDRIKQLDVKGLKRLWLIVSGIYSKNQQSVSTDTQRVQELSLQIQKILMRRIEFVSTALFSLNKKVDSQTLLMEQTLSMLIQKLEQALYRVDDAFIMSKLNMWYVSVENRKEESGKRYTEVSDGMKILLVVSDLFQIVHERNTLIEKPWLEGMLRKLGIGQIIDETGFYEDLICDKECLPLYIKDYYDYQAGGVSCYGQMINKIYGFCSNPLFYEVSEAIDISLEELCKKVIRNEVRGKCVHPVDLCLNLLGDLVSLNSEMQIKMKERVELVEEPPQNEKSCPEPSQEEEYSILRMTPEVLHQFKQGAEVSDRLDCEKTYIFKDEQMLGAYLKKCTPYLVTAPSAYVHRHAMPEIRTRIAMNSKYISLSDYYMYLWFRNTTEKERSNKKLVFISYYKDELFATAYFVYESGEGYKKELLKKMPHGRRIADMIKEIKSCKCFENIPKEEILMFQTFESDVQNLWKLKKEQGVKMVESAWEDILHVNNCELRDIIRDMIDKTNEAII